MNHEFTKPLAERMRPKSLEGFIGQEHLIGENASIYKAIKSSSIPSMILWGPPGVGKTSLAQIISNDTNRAFYTLSAISSGVKDIREIINRVESGGMFSQGNAILFIDEIHRFSKSQQDSLLAAVEKGIITLIGATTENPSFEVISALLSRCQVFVLKHHTKEELLKAINLAINTDEKLKQLDIDLKETDALLKISGGDIRKLYNALELTINNYKGDTIEITNKIVIESIQENIATYDKNGEMHYDIISAFIKSIRGSDPNAAVYWLARMIQAGEDVKFIARRLLILASEDIGLANTNALLMANTCFGAVEKIGFPESRIILSQTVIYLATSAKSNSAYMAINKAQELVKKTGNLSVPLHLRNAPTKLMKNLNYGKDYAYSHNNIDNLHKQEFFPDEIKHNKIYTPSNNKRELDIASYLSKVWKGKYEY